MPTCCAASASRDVAHSFDEVARLLGLDQSAGDRSSCAWSRDNRHCADWPACGARRARRPRSRPPRAPATLPGLLVSSRTAVDPERAQHRRGMAIVALVVGKAEPPIGIDRVEPAVLQRIGAELVGKADPAAFLAEVEQHAAAGLADDPQRFLELRPAIAFQRAEHVAGQAFAVQPDQRRLAAERADDQRDMLLPVVGGAEGDDLRSAACPSSGSLARATISTDGCRRSRTMSSTATPASRHWPDRAATTPEAARPTARGRARRVRVSAQSRGDRLERADRRRGRGRGRDRRSPAPSRRRARARARSAPARRDRRRRARLASFSAAARSPLISSRARCCRDRAGRAAPASRSRPRRSRSAAGTVDPHRPPGAQRGDRPRGPALGAQTSISQISGTWSDGRSQLRHGSSTSCALRWPASSGEAHIWSSRRPRSFLVQSGER